ncbi:MAG TPA: hypothetical protein VM098_01140 [Phycisphaerae bacterium]|nr:hypothetical protein [Phycisphaerae bacterium]
MRRRMVLVLVAASVIGACWLTQALSQQTRQQGQTGQARRDRTGRAEDFRLRMQERMREQLGANEQEWKVLQPRIEKIQQLQRDTRGGFRARAGRGARRPGEAQPPAAAAAAEREQSEVQKKTEALSSLLDDEAANAGAIKAALDALRKARENAQKDLAAARKELQGVVTVRQEARLVLMNILE